MEDKRVKNVSYLPEDVKKSSNSVTLSRTIRLCVLRGEYGLYETNKRKKKKEIVENRAATSVGNLKNENRGKKQNAPMAVGKASLSL